MFTIPPPPCMSSPITKSDLELSDLLLHIIPSMMRSVRGYMRDYDGANLTVPQFRILGFVSLQPYCTSKQLADWSGVSLPAISRMVDGLVKRRLLQRTASASDRRQYQLRLSKQGATEFQEMRDALQAQLAARIAGLTGPNRKALAAGLTALQELFRDA
jgi:DNA-binding MarR family transcriptional regulator